MLAPIVQHNKNVTKSPQTSSPQDGGYANLYLGKKRNYGELVESAPLSELAQDAFVSNRQLSSRYIDYSTLTFSPTGGTNQARQTFLVENDQTFTASNQALLVDTLRGGWRTDLSDYLKDTAKPMQGSLAGQAGPILKDLDPLLPHQRFKNFSPKFGALRDYLRIGDEAGTARTISPRAPIFGGGKYNDYPDPLRFVKHGVHPVIAEYSVYMRPVVDKNAPSKISMLFYPRVTLWNPYNVKISTSQYFVQINQRSYIKLIVDQGPDRGKVYDYTSSYWGLNPLPNDGSTSRSGYQFYYLEATSLEPGQSLVFSPAHSGYKKLAYRNDDITGNLLSAKSDVSDLNCFYVNMNSNSPINIDGPTPSYRFDSMYNNGFHIGYGDSTSARLRIAKSRVRYANMVGGGGDSPDYPIVHTLDANAWIRGNQGRWRSIADSNPVLKIEDSMNVPPNNRTKMGMRFKALRETPSNRLVQRKGFWNYPLLELSNLRAPFYRRSPWDWLFPVQTVVHEYSYGPLAGENQQQPDYLDPLMLPRYVNGVSESTPFMNASSTNDLRFAPFDIPPPGVEVFSIGQLRQVPLTQEFGAPSFIIGESSAAVTAPREKSAFPLTEYKARWNNAFSLGEVKNFSTWWQSEYEADQSYSSFDYRYETNLALWDRFFFSTKAKGSLLDDYRDPGTLPNQNMVVINDSGTDLKDASASKADVIARHLRQMNHQSVNSTNLIAWKALLSMNMGMDIDGKSTGSGETPFPGISSPLTGGIQSESESRSETWTGYRQLTNAEIDTLAKEIVSQVKQRAPFISLADFVNRRLLKADAAPHSIPTVSRQSAKDLLSYAGPIEIAIQKANLNSEMREQVKAASGYDKLTAQDSRAVEVTFATANAPSDVYANAPAHLTQGKVLETIGASLTPRSDTFRVRGYGEARDSAGNVTARAWCEALVQRTSEYIDTKADDANKSVLQLTSDVNKTHGRRFKIETFRWLNENEINVL